MQCPKCQFENPEEMQFCGRCGTKLENVPHFVLKTFKGIA